MKFQKLTIHNIASIEDAEIDFEAQPLADSEIFLITGKTGAGKSTILDAICLALFADTPRLQETQMDGKVNDLGTTVLSVNDPRHLMRRGTFEAHSTLTFTGTNGVHYEAKWLTYRANKKLDGKIQDKKWELTNLDTGMTYKKVAEITSEIRAAIGLDFSQFCRTTLLAQGEFTRFLNSSDVDKAAILEKITGVDAYSKIGAKVYAITGEKEMEWKTAQSLAQETRTLSQEEIAERQALLDQLDAQYASLKQSSDQEMTKCEWIKDDNSFKQGLNEASEALLRAQAAVDNETYTSDMRLVNEWKSTIEARHWLGEMQKSASVQQTQQKTLDVLQETFIQVLCGQRHNVEQLDALAQRLRETENFLAAVAPYVPVYEQAQTVASQLNIIAEGRKTIENGGLDIAKETQTLNSGLSASLEKAREEAASVRERYGKEEAAVRKLEADVTALKLTSLRQQRDAAGELLVQVRTAQERLETLSLAKAQREEKKQNLLERMKGIEARKIQVAELAAPLHDAQIRMEARKEALDLQSDTIAKFSKTLRLKLHMGDTCPVCRQKITSELPHEEELTALVAGLQAAYDEAEKACKELNESKIKLEAEISTETMTYHREQKVMENDQTVAVAEQKALDACMACGLTALDDSTPSSLALLAAHQQSAKDKLETDIRRGEQLEIELNGLRHRLDDLRRLLEGCNETVLQVEKAVSDCKNRIAMAEALIASKRREIESAERQVKKRLASLTWDLDWQKEPSLFATDLLNKADRHQMDLQLRQRLLSEQQTVQALYDHVASILASITDAMPAWREFTATSSLPLADLHEQASTLSSKVLLALTQLESAQQDYSNYETRLNHFLASETAMTLERLSVLNGFSAHDISNKDELLKKSQEEVVAKEAVYKRVCSQHDEHQQKRPTMTDDDTLESLTERISSYEKQLSEIGEQKGAILQELRLDTENKERLGALLKDADEKKETYEKWSRMNQLIGDSTGAKFRKIAQSYVLDSLIHSANFYMKTLTDRYTLKVTPGTFVILLEDAYQGYATRAATTISGGESFLVSLSLALALSDIGQKLSVDTLFIDEGFGTLSGQPLQNAISTLRSLHSKSGRHVGIISHVEELKERIPVQIQVNQEGNSSSSIVRIVSGQNCT